MPKFWRIEIICYITTHIVKVKLWKSFIKSSSAPNLSTIIPFELSTANFNKYLLPLKLIKIAITLSFILGISVWMTVSESSPCDNHFSEITKLWQRAEDLVLALNLIDV